MDSAHRCPYDGFRMEQERTERYGRGAFVTYKCPSCGHVGVSWFFEGELINSRGSLACSCKGCRSERRRTGNIILKE